MSASSLASMLKVLIQYSQKIVRTQMMEKTDKPKMMCNHDFHRDHQLEHRFSNILIFCLNITECSIIDVAANQRMAVKDL